MKCTKVYLSFIVISFSIFTYSETLPYSWLREYNETDSIAQRIPTPKGYVKTEVEKVNDR